MIDLSHYRFGGTIPHYVDTLPHSYWKDLVISMLSVLGIAMQKYDGTDLALSYQKFMDSLIYKTQSLMTSHAIVQKLYFQHSSRQKGQGKLLSPSPT